MHVAFCHIGREHLGIEILSAVLKQEGHSVSLEYDPAYFSKQDNTVYNPFLARIFYDERSIIRRLVAANPDVIGFSVYTGTYQWALRITREAKKMLSVPVVFGGPHATLCPEIVMSNDCVDYVIVGEGEVALPALLSSLESRREPVDVANVWYKKGRTVLNNPVSQDLVDLDTLPIPDKALFEDYISYKDDYMITASRGCPYSCSYCCESYLNSIYKNNFYRQRGIDFVIPELIHMKQRYQFKEVNFFDSIFYSSKQWLRDFVKEYSKNVGVRYKCMANIFAFDKEVAILLKEHGCYCVNFGISSMDRFVREQILKRRIDTSRILEVLKMCDDISLPFDIDLMFDLPGQTSDMVAQYTNSLKQFKHLNRIKCFSLVYYPRLDIVDTAQKRNILSPQDIEALETGRDKSGFFRAPKEKKRQRKNMLGVMNMHRILPLLPAFLLRALVAKRRYRCLYYVPGPIIVVLQLAIGLVRRDYRFYIYLKEYGRRAGYLLTGLRALRSRNRR